MLSARFSPITASPIIPIFASSGFVSAAILSSSLLPATAVVRIISFCSLLICEQSSGGFVDQPQQRAAARTNELTRINVGLIASFEHVPQGLSLVFACCEKSHVASVVDRRGGQGDAVSFELIHI